MRHPRLLLAVLIAGAVSTPLAATAALAAPAAKPPVTHGHKAKNSHGKPAKAPKPVKVTAAGTLAAVDAAGSTVTVTVKGGTKNLHGTTTVFRVAVSTRITRDDTVTALGDLRTGDAVSVQATKTDTGYTASRINAESPLPASDPSETDPAPEPSSDATPHS
jgi:hypothetical protein